MKTRDDHIEFLRLNGVRVAACAWNGFQAKGRGLVCVLCELENEVLRTVPFDFMPEKDAAKLFKPWAGSKESRMLAAYDPAMEVVICFVRKGEGDRATRSERKGSRRCGRNCPQGLRALVEQPPHLPCGHPLPRGERGQVAHTLAMYTTTQRPRPPPGRRFTPAARAAPRSAAW